jgi:hypothetical protein
MRAERNGMPNGNPLVASNTILDWTNVVYIIRYKEDVARLKRAFAEEGFQVHLQEGPYTAEQLTYSPSIQCLVNHANAWRRVKASGMPAIIVEPDFVPVRGFGAMTCPMPNDRANPAVGMAWLYACGPILYGIDKRGCLFGHATSVAGYLLTPEVAEKLLQFFEREMARPVPGEYRAWDSALGVYLRKECGVLNYLPYRQLGEHGSDSRAEHKAFGMSKNWHQADHLAAPLHFLPIYSEGSYLRFARYRLRAWSWGLVRLITLRYFNPKHVNESTARGRVRMAAVSVARMLPLFG